MENQLENEIFHLEIMILQGHELIQFNWTYLSKESIDRASHNDVGSFSISFNCFVKHRGSTIYSKYKILICICICIFINTRKYIRFIIFIKWLLKKIDRFMQKKAKTSLLHLTNSRTFRITQSCASTFKIFA